MVDSIFTQAQRPPGTIARMKVTPPETVRQQTGLTGIERQLSDIVDIGGQVQDRVRDMRKLDAYLRVFSAALKIINGAAPTHKPQFSKVEVEFVKPK